MPLWHSAAMVGLGGLIGLVSAYFSQRWAMRNSVRLSGRQRRHEVYGRLIRDMHESTEWHRWVCDWHIMSVFYQRRTDGVKPRPDDANVPEFRLAEGRREAARAESLKATSAVLATVGSIRMLFCNDAEISGLADKAVQAIREYRREMTIHNIPQTSDETILLEWKEAEIERQRRRVDATFGGPLDRLADKVGSVLRADVPRA